MDAAMSSAVSGLLAESTALSNISDNLANSSTTGYKSVTTTFTSLLTELTNGATYTSGGVSASVRQNVTAQGTITATSVATDMAISGAGMFAVTNGVSGTQTYYTRDGAFSTDSTGNLYLSGTNYYLEGYAVKNGVAATSTSIVNIDSQMIDTPVATTQYSLSANFPAAAQDDLGTFSYTNSSGTTEDLSMAYVQTSTDSTAGTTTYEVAINAASGTTITDGTGTASQLLYSVTVGSGGTITGVTSLTSGDTYNGTTLPDLTPSDSSTAVTLPGGGTDFTTFAADAGTGFSKSTSMTVYDSLGVAETASVTWTASGDNTWLMTVHSPSGGTLTDSNGSAVSSYSYQVSFNSNGSLNTITSLPTGETDATTGTAGSAPISSSGEPAISALWTDGAAASTGTAAVSIWLGTAGKSDGLSQFSSSSSTSLSITVNSYSQNGMEEGTMTGVSVSSSGDVIAAYSNGNTATIYEVPVVTFANENGLTELSGGVYQATEASGGAVYNVAGTGAAGTIEGETLESSTVNTTTEFANMITTQQAYSSASQVISTDKQMFTSLIQAIA